MSVILYVEIYEKQLHVQLNNLHSTAMALSLFLGAEAYGKIAAYDCSGLRSPCSHSCTGELQIAVEHLSNFCSLS